MGGRRAYHRLVVVDLDLKGRLDFIGAAQLDVLSQKQQIS
jgi:hypothetical protein